LKFIQGIKQFEISFEEISKSYPFIQFKVKKGKRKLLSIRKKLNSGILKNVGEKEPLRHSPHMTIGIIEDKKEFEIAVKELKKTDPKFKMKVDKITLMALNKDMTLRSKKEFRLK